MDLPSKVLLVESASTPSDEKYDIQVELLKEHLAGLDLEDLGFLQDQITTYGLHPFQQEFGPTSALIQKAQQVNPVGVFRVVNRPGGHRSHLTVNQLGVLGGGPMNQNWIEKSSPFGFSALKAMVDGCAILNAVIVTYIREILQFATPYRSQDEHPLGFTILPKDKKIGDKLTPDEEKVCKAIERFLMNCGDEEDPRRRRWNNQRDNFSGFLAKLIRDSLTMDAAPIETEMSRNGQRLSGIYSVAGETVRLCHEYGYEGDDRIVAVQIFNDLPVAFYTPSDIIYEVRNPRTDLLVSGYGMAECEMVVRTVTSFLNAFNYNSFGFDRNNIPRGILTVYGNFEDKQVNAFKRQWNSMLSGPAGRWRLPTFISKDGKEAGASFEPVDMQFNEMHFAKWMSFLVSIICAIFGKSPENINFDSFSSRASALSGTDTAEKLAASKDKGLEPLMSWIEGIVNEYVIPIYHKGYEMHFVGLRQEDQERIFEMKMSTMRVNEGRKMWGGEEDDEYGDLPLNPQLLGYKQQQEMAEQMANQPDPTEEDQYGVPQGVIDRMKEDGGQGGMNAGQKGGVRAAAQNNPDVSKGPAKLAAAERDVKKSAREFLVFADIRDREDFPPKDDRHEGWSM